MTGAGEPPRQEDDEPLLARTGRLPKPDPVTLDRAVRVRIRQAAGAVALWVPARVVAVANDARGGPYIVVDYSAPGLEGGIRRDSQIRYYVGEILTAYYDPADPSHVRTADEPNGDDSWGSIVVVVLELGAFSWALTYTVVMVRRRRIARRSGWQPVKVAALGHGSFFLNRAGRDRKSVRIVAAVGSHYSFLTAAPTRAWLSGEVERLGAGGAARPLEQGPVRHPAQPLSRQQPAATGTPPMTTHEDCRRGRIRRRGGVVLPWWPVCRRGTLDVDRSMVPHRCRRLWTSASGTPRPNCPEVSGNVRRSIAGRANRRAAHRHPRAGGTG
ncbi:DUF3592 domain-containing protein [Amycolatopsis sp. NPDC051372]|uniref:DUF3592 domain-containing protein n=1 Tax=Amycolatopsis sp. NPDC051372 TaxID=3155669 RepID=UPI00341C4303